MKTVKTTLIVLATLAGVAIVLFFGSALIAGFFGFVKKPLNINDKIFVEEKVDSFANAMKGKSVMLVTFKTEPDIPLYQTGFDDIGKVLTYIDKYTWVTISNKREVVNNKIPVDYDGFKGYVYYYNIYSLDRLWKRDPDINKYP